MQELRCANVLKHASAQKQCSVGAYTPPRYSHKLPDDNSKQPRICALYIHNAECCFRGAPSTINLLSTYKMLVCVPDVFSEANPQLLPGLAAAQGPHELKGLRVTLAKPHEVGGRQGEVLIDQGLGLATYTLCQRVQKVRPALVDVWAHQLGRRLLQNNLATSKPG